MLQETPHYKPSRTNYKRWIHKHLIQPRHSEDVAVVKLVGVVVAEPIVVVAEQVVVVAEAVEVEHDEAVVEAVVVDVAVVADKILRLDTS